MAVLGSGWFTDMFGLANHVVKNVNADVFQGDVCVLVPL